MNYSTSLELIASDILEQHGQKPNYSNRDFLNTIIIFQSALMDKMFDVQQSEKMDMKQREEMATKCGEDLRKLIRTYTNLDTHNLEQFL